MTDNNPAEEAAREWCLHWLGDLFALGSLTALLTTREAELRARIDALIEPGKATTYVKWAFDLAESLGYSSVSASGPGPFIEAKLAELKAEIERLNREWPEDASLEKRRAEKAEAALAEMGSRLWQTANDPAEAQKRVERLESQRGKCLVRGCRDDAKSRHSVCYNHRQELSTGNWKLSEAISICQEFPDASGSTIEGIIRALAPENEEE